MKNILIHGLGQNETSWNKVKDILNNNYIDVGTPNLFNISEIKKSNICDSIPVFPILPISSLSDNMHTAVFFTFSTSIIATSDV